jgi:hypothetical protein
MAARAKSRNISDRPSLVKLLVEYQPNFTGESRTIPSCAHTSPAHFTSLQIMVARVINKNILSGFRVSGWISMKLHMGDHA